MNEQINSEDILTEDQDSNEIEIEVVDDTPEQDRGRPRRADGAEPEIPDDDEISNYSDNVQSRIKKLRFEYHEERRRKEESERIRDEAVAYAKKLHEENQKLQANLKKGESVLVQQAKTRVESQLDKAKQDYKQAYEVGDADKIVEAQEAISKYSSEKSRLERYRPRPQAKTEEFDAQQVAQSIEQNARATIQPPPEPDQEAQDWASRNPWFGKDKAMTGYAFGVHEELVESGIDPRSPEYYDRIDEAVKNAFPDRGAGQAKQGASVVAPAIRSSKTPRKIKLTGSQIALAKRLGLTNEQYAAQMLKEMRP